MNDRKPARRRYLVIGALLGAGLAASGIVQRVGAGFGANVIAKIDGESLSAAAYSSSLQAAQKKSEKPLSWEQQQQVLQAMIDERLLLQHALQSGLLETDTAVRRALLDAVVENIVSAYKGVEPTDAELQLFYAEHGSYFRKPSMVTLQRMVFRGSQALENAELAHARLTTGEAFESVKAQFASPDILTLPTGMLPASRLDAYLGPTLSQAALSLPRGQFSSPLPADGSYVILRSADTESARKPPLNTVHSQVVREFKRWRNDLALQDYIADLRRSAEIRINESLLIDGEVP